MLKGRPVLASPFCVERVDGKYCVWIKILCVDREEG